MYSNLQRLSSPAVQELRREGGRVLKQMREARGLSQRQLCELVGGGVYTFVSQLETGRGRIPPDKLRVWADALGIPPRQFVTTLMRYYDPETHAILFGDGETEPGSKLSDGDAIPTLSPRPRLSLVP